MLLSDSESESQDDDDEADEMESTATFRGGGGGVLRKSAFKWAGTVLDGAGGLLSDPWFRSSIMWASSSSCALRIITGEEILKDCWFE